MLVALHKNGVCIVDLKLLLVKIVTLLYVENRNGTVSETSTKLIGDALDAAPFRDVGLLPAGGTDTLHSLRRTIQWMLKLPSSETFDQQDLIQRLRVNTENDETIFGALYDGLTARRDDDQSKKLITQCQRDIREYMEQLKVEKIVREASRKLSGPKDKIDWRHFVKELRTELKPYNTIGGRAKHNSIIDDFDLDDPDTLSGAMERRVVELSSEGVMRTGIQALNRMFGQIGGIRRGEFCCIGALQHNNKSGLVLKILEGVALYNTPFLRNPDKKPLLLHISFENDASDNFCWLYKSLKEQEIGELTDPSAVPIEEIHRYVSMKLQATGYHIKMMRIDPSDFTYHDLFELVANLEEDGYEIHIAFIDYLNMMSKKGCETGPHGQEIRDLFRRTRNCFSKKGIAVVTPHQLSSDAKRLIRMGIDDFVKQVKGKGYWDGCTRLDQEFDFEMYVHIVIQDDKSYLTMQRGKHRGFHITPPADHFCVLPFHPVGGIKNDIEGVDLSSKWVGVSGADGGAAPWFS